MEIEELYSLFTQCTGITTDSRNCPKDSMFVGLRGEHFDGNTFVEKAIEMGCKYALTDKKEYAGASTSIIYVEDCLKALQDLARYHRRTLNTTIVGITGTNGKTTTKELIAAVLRKKYKVLATEGNFNNHLGVPLTLLRLTKEHEVAVVEMGANHPGEIEFLTHIVQPNYGIVTNVGKAHLLGFGSFEGVMRTKAELYDFLRFRKRKAFIDADNLYLQAMSIGVDAYYYGQNEKYTVNGKVLSCDPYLNVEINIKKDNFSFSTKLIGNYNLSNILSAASVGLCFKVPSDAIVEAISEYQPSNNRSQRKVTEKNTLIIDAYNANPTSMEAALRNFAAVELPNKAVILGDMFELGKDSRKEHHKIITLLQELGIQEAYLLGENFSAISHDFHGFSSTDKFKTYLKSHSLEGKTILLKGSNSMKLNSLVELL